MSGMIDGGKDEDGVREPLARAGAAHRGSAAWAARSRRRSMSRAPSRRTPSARSRVRRFEVESSIRRGPMALSAPSWTVIFLRRVPLRTGRARLLLTSGKISGAKDDEGLCESRARAGASRRGSPQGTARVRRAPSPRAPSRRRPGLRSRPACVEAPPSIGTRAETDVIAIRSRSRGTVF